VTDTLPPQDLLAEQVVIGACLYEPGDANTLTAILRSTDFYRAEHQRIWAEVSACVDRDWQPDMMRLVERVRSSGVFADGPVGPEAYLGECLARFEIGMRPAEYAEAVREQSTRRAMIGAARKITEAAHSESTIDEAANVARVALRSALTREESGVTVQTVGAAASEWFDEIEARADGKVAAPKGIIPTRIAHLDHYLRGGVKRGQLVVIGARISHGKTTLALQMACGAARSGHAAAYFSLEMPRTELLEKIACAEFGLHASDLDDQPMSGETMRIIGQACAAVAEWPMVLLVPGESARVTAARIASKCSELDLRPELVIVDNLGQIDFERDRGETDARAIGRVTRDLKRLAMEQDCAVILCCQLNRGPEQRENKEPQLSDLRDSGSIEADADVVILLSLPGNYLGKEAGGRTSLEECVLKVGKQRMGRTGRVPHMRWNPQRVCFVCSEVSR
jgi:replicative DNA helicase